MRSVIVVTFLLILQKSQGKKQALCKIQSEEWSWAGQTQELTTCRPNVTTIEDDDFTVKLAKNSKVLALEIRNREGVKFLPTKLSSSFPELIAIHVCDCSVTSVKENHFKGLSELKVLSLAHNEIENISGDAFVDLVSLEDLGLNSNKIEILEKSTFSSLIALKELYLASNEIQTLHPHIFNSLVNVEYIDLNGNKMVSLQENIFENLANLKKISAIANELTALPKNLFKNNSMLKEVSFSENKIKFIDENIFDNLVDLQSIDLEGNECLSENFNATSFDSLKESIENYCNMNWILEISGNALEVADFSKPDNSTKVDRQSSTTS